GPVGISESLRANSLTISGTTAVNTFGISITLTSPQIVLSGGLIKEFSGSPIPIRSGGSGSISLTAVASNTVLIADSVDNETVSLVGTSSATSGSFNLSVTGTASNIVKGTAGLIAS